MDLRKVQILAPRGVRREIKDTLLAYKTGEVRENNINTKIRSINFFATSAGAKELLDIFEKRFHNKEWFRIILSPIEATLPRIEWDELPDETLNQEEKEKAEKEEKNKTLFSKITQFSIVNLLKIHPEELYQKILWGTVLDSNKILLYFLSAIVATIGLAYNNIPVIIGSMVIAPFLWPNVGLALGTTLWDKDLIGKALKNLLVGTLLVLIIAVILGIIYPWSGDLTNQVYISYYMIILSFVSGISAILYLLQNNDSWLVGVMVAVSLLPPLTLAGLLFWAGEFLPAFKAFILFLSNIICLNLAGIGTFLLAGVRPTHWREIKKAKKQTRIAVGIRSLLLFLLLILIYFFTQ